MTQDNLQQFLAQMTGYVEVELVSEILEKLEKKVKAVMVAKYAKEIAEYASMGVAVASLCEKTDNDSIQTMAMSGFKKISGPVLSTINKIRLSLAVLTEMNQAWDAIPSLKDIEELIKSEFDKHVSAAIKAAFSEALKVVVCGSKFQRFSMMSMQGAVSEQLVLLTSLSAVKSLYETLDKAD